jgi:PAS domain S-box-containing protein
MDLQDRPTTAPSGICPDRLRLAVDQAADAIMLTDIDGTITFVNAACASLTGYPASELVGRNPRVLGSGTHPPRFFRELTRTLAAGEAWRGEIVNRRADGSLYVEERTITPVRDADGRLDGYVSIGRDVTERHPRAVMAEHAGGRREPVAVPVASGATPPPAPIVLRRHNRLMPRDLALLRLLLAGRSLSDAAAELGVAIGTAKNRRHEVYQKLGVGSLANAARRLRELGIELEVPARD